MSRDIRVDHGFALFQPAPHRAIVHELASVGGGDSLLDGGKKPVAFMQHRHGGIGEALLNRFSGMLGHLGELRFLFGLRSGVWPEDTSDESDP